MRPVAKPDKTYKAVFADPVSASIAWADVESMFVSRGARFTNGGGSMVRVEMRGKVAVFHRPHPQEAKRSAIRSVRRFLQSAEAAAPAKPAPRQETQ